MISNTLANEEGKSDFGRYLQSVAERDIDLLLMEEFHVDHSFASWFASLAGINASAKFDGAWHSLNDQDGETDLLLRVCVGGERIALLIENKVGAPPQNEQDIRYHLRGQRSQEAGRCDRFITAICAPQIYLDGMPDNSAYEHRIPYEVIRDWYGRKSDSRASWRRAIMSEAIEQGRRGYTMKVHAGKTAFHMAYWQMMLEQYPSFIMAKPGPKGPKSDWMRFKCADFPKGVTLNHKNDQGCMDLEFERTSVTELAGLRDASWPQAIRILPRGKSAALSLSIPSCNMDRPLSSQTALVRASFEAALALAGFASIKNG